jgi:hypothetical protein
MIGKVARLYTHIINGAAEQWDAGKRSAAQWSVMKWMVDYNTVDRREKIGNDSMEEHFEWIRYPWGYQQYMNLQ